MSKISVDVMKDAARSAAEMLDSAPPEVKLVLENPHFALGLCVVLHNEVSELRKEVAALKSQKPADSKKGLTTPMPQAQSQAAQPAAKETVQAATPQAPVSAESAAPEAQPQPTPEAAQPQQVLQQPADTQTEPPKEMSLLS